MDRLFIHGLKTTAILGIRPSERKKEQPILIDLDIKLSPNTQRAIQTDTIEHTVDYSELTAYLLKFVHSSHFYLLETLADKTAQCILDKFKRVSWLRLTLQKPQALSATSQVGITIERDQSEEA